MVFIRRHFIFTIMFVPNEYSHRVPSKTFFHNTVDVWQPLEVGPGWCSMMLVSCCITGMSSRVVIVKHTFLFHKLHPIPSAPGVAQPGVVRDKKLR